MKKRKVPMRKCIGCMESKPKADLVRIVMGDEGLTADITGRAHGRGAYLCKSERCFGAAVKRNAFRRALEGDIKPEDISSLGEIFEKYRATDDEGRD